MLRQLGTRTRTDHEVKTTNNDRMATTLSNTTRIRHLSRDHKFQAKQQHRSGSYTL